MCGVNNNVYGFNLNSNDLDSVIPSYFHSCTASNRVRGIIIMLLCLPSRTYTYISIRTRGFVMVSRSRPSVLERLCVCFCRRSQRAESLKHAFARNIKIVKNTLLLFLRSGVLLLLLYTGGTTSWIRGGFDRVLRSASPTRDRAHFPPPLYPSDWPAAMTVIPLDSHDETAPNTNARVMR